ncbi:Rab-3 [Penaeus vannamei]|uniref:Rab-3 n=1 Tax=Penaeus vannamei TaxID=6689 RepID=A0A3R7SJT3_PENVA|nr:Rab-3 [Penaeus vannamei]
MAVSQDNRWQKDAADQNFDYMFKLLIIGNSSVGKTSFLFRYADDSFTSAFVSTVGIDFKVKTVFLSVLGFLDTVVDTEPAIF